MPIKTYRTGAESDDAYWYGTTFRSGYAEVSVGNYSGTPRFGFLRFPNIDIPHGAEILSAHLELCAYGSLTGYAAWRIYVNAIDDAVAPTSVAETELLDIGESETIWDSIPAWTNGEVYETPAISDHIQEIVSRDGWESGNAILLWFENCFSTTRRDFWGYSGKDQGNKHPALIVEYTDSGGTTTTVDLSGLAFGTSSEMTLREAYAGLYAEIGAFETSSAMAVGTVNHTIHLQGAGAAFETISAMACVPTHILNIGIGFDTVSGMAVDSPVIFKEVEFIETYLCRLDEVVLPMSSFQGRFKSGKPSFLSVVIPGVNHASAITAHANGKLSVTMVRTYPSGNTITEMLMEVDLDEIRTDKGIENASITLTGYRTVTYNPKAIELEGANYGSTIKGLKRYRCLPHPYLRPGDIVNVDGQSFTADEITMAFAVGQKTMEVAER